MATFDASALLLWPSAAFITAAFRCGTKSFRLVFFLSQQRILEEREREREREGLEKVERERESVAKQLIAKIVDKMDASEEWLNRKA